MASAFNSTAGGADRTLVGREDDIRRWALPIGVIVAVVLVAGAVAIGTRDDGPTFCTAEGMIGDNGQIYGRDPNQGCEFVDENGKIVPDW